MKIKIMTTISPKIALLQIFTLFTIITFGQKELFEEKYFKNGDFILPYRLLKPLESNPQPNSKLTPVSAEEKLYPLIVFLHGAGERGSDNVKQLTYIDTIFTDSAFQAKYPTFVVAPQCPEKQRWVEVDWKLPEHKMPEKISKPLESVVLLIDTLLKEYPINPKRVYLVGLSMGGFGTWELLARYPNKFAAAIPICGGADLSTACIIRHIPIWTFHGAKDKVVKVERSRQMVDAIKKCNGKKIIYTEYPDGDHLIWNRVFNNPKVWEWLFSN